MKKINYPLIVSDFDGTLVKEDGTIAKETSDTIKQYIQDGGTFGICTGRLLPGILPRAKELGLKGLLACFQGAVIVDIETEEVLLEGYLDSEDAAEICKVMEDMDLHIHVYEFDKFYCNRDDWALKEYERIVGVQGIVYTEKPLSQRIREEKMQVVKVLTMVDPQDKIRVYEQANKLLGDRFYVTYSAAFLVEVTQKKYSKGTAVEFMANHYGVPVEKTVAVGDALNDLPMLQRAGVGLAVKNADDQLKSLVTPFGYTNEENAIGKIIEEYGYMPEE